MIASTSGCATSAAPTVSPTPWTTLNTPGGIPASSASSATTTAVIGVCSAGLRTTLLPAQSANVAIAAAAVGPFHGHDRPDHAERLAHLVDGELARHGGDAAVQLRGPARVVVDAVDRELDDEPGVETEQARVDDVELGELVAVLGDQRGEPAQPPLLLERRQVSASARRRTPRARTAPRARRPRPIRRPRSRPARRSRDRSPASCRRRATARLRRRRRGRTAAGRAAAQRRPRSDTWRDRSGRSWPGSRSRCLARGQLAGSDPTSVQPMPRATAVKHNDVTSVDELLDRTGSPVL